MEKKVIYLSSLEEMYQFSQKVALILQKGDVLLLKGDLGTGKSEFARSTIQFLSQGTKDVPSPTFTLVQTYACSQFTIWHFDLYRLTDSSEVYELGIEEAYVNGVSLIEWPENLGSWQPDEYLQIELQYGKGDHERQATLTSTSQWSSRLRTIF